jgi:hypothetical protein
MVGFVTSKYPLWPFYTSMGFISFGMLLIILRAGVRTSLIFFLLSIFFLIVWIYYIIKIDIKRNRKNEDLCICTICSHKQSDICIKKKCPCCINVKDNNVIEHSNNSFY